MASEFSAPLVILFLCSVKISSPQIQVPLDCLPGWEMKEHQCYKLFSNLLPWVSAGRMCASYGGHLAMPFDYYTNEDIGEYVNFQGVNEFWLGADRIGVSPSDNVTLFYNGRLETRLWVGHWSIYQPKFTDEDCVFVSKFKRHHHRWSFSPCERTLPFLCQRPSCFPGSFHCVNGRCISPKGKCDGYNDCGDRSDETDCPQLCSWYIRTSTQGIVNYPDNGLNYSNNAVCLWLIETDVGTHVQLTVTSLSLENTSDEMIIMDGGLTESSSVEIVHLTGHSTFSEYYYSSDNKMLLKFTSDGSVTNTGFSVTYSQGNPSFSSKNLNATNTWQELEFPYYNSSLLGGQDLYYVVETEDQTKTVSFQVLDIDLPADATVMIRDGNTVYSSILAKLYGTYKGSGTFLSSGRYLYVALHTVRGSRSRGLKVRYIQGCQSSLDQSTGYISSPGYPVSFYPNGVTCNWVVNVSGVQNLTIIFNSLDIHISDRIQIMVENYPVGDYSGNSTQMPLRITGGQFSVVFTSSSTMNHHGFNLTYSVDCPQPTIDLGLSNIIGKVSASFGSEFIVTCKQGSQFFQSEHIGKTNVTMICMAFGQWNVNTSPKCERIQCQKVPSVLNGYIARSVGNLPYNGTLTYKCYQGYMLVGRDTVTCDVNGRWVNLPFCQASSCGTAPPADPNGNVYIAAVNASFYGTVLRYSCNQGYDLIGQPTLFCDSNGSYVGNPGTCKILTCYISSILNGIISSNKVQVGQQITLTCNTGYRSTTGETSMLCNSNRTLTPALSCQNINECEDKSRCQHRCIDTEGSYYCTCNQGYEVIGNFCRDIDECKLMSPCSDVCTNIEGSYQCSCPAGYSLFVANGTQGHLIPPPEDGNYAGDVYQLNHTCVRNVCSSPPAIVNTFVLSQKTTYYYEDTVMYKCQLGYILENPITNTLRCSQSGNWTGIEIKCTRAVCVVEPGPTNLVNPGILSPNITSIFFGEFLTITCNVPGFTPQTFFRRRQCTLIGSSYRLDGSITDYECGFISCGKPYDEPGSNYTGLSTYYYRSSFTFSCQPTFKLSGNSFETGNTTVTCQNSGQWDFGNLTCTGAQCMDPGQPYLGSQASSDYREGQLVVFSCSERGYTLRPPNPISCGLLQNGTAKFNGSLPVCVDTQVPNITNCPQNEIVVARQMSVGAAVPELQIQDNGGIRNVAVVPAWPSSQYYVTSVQTPVRFTYTVTDYGNNQAVCTISFRRRDDAPPIIICPPTPLTYTFRTENDTRFIIVDRGWVTVNDDGTLAAQLNVTFSVESYTFDPKSLLLVTVPPTQYTTILATVVDAAGNSASCSFGLFFQPDVCSPYSLRTPANSNKKCVAVGPGYNCTITCNQGYRLFNNILSNSVSTYCSAPGVVFSPLYDVKCVNATSQDGSYKLEFDFVYDMRNINNNCKDSYENIIRNTLYNLTVSKSVITDTFCDTGAVFVQGKIGLGYITVMEMDKKILVHYAVSFDRRPGDNYSKCAAGVKFIMNEPQSYQISLVQFKSTACDPIILTKNISLTFEGYYCEDPTRILVSPNGHQNLSYCLSCPEGTFFNSGMCTLCPRGTFGEVFNLNTCQPCPKNTSTYSSGAVNRSECAFECGPGFFSTNGLPPCYLCPKNTFWENATNCLSCPSSGVTRVAGAKSQMDCKVSCLPGTFNEIDGHESCKTCPVHHYSNQTAALICTECAYDEYTNSTGKISVSDCLKLNQTQCMCQNGYCVSRLPHITSCICYDGWTGEYCNKPFDSCASHPCYNGGTCVKNGSSYICSCPTGTMGTKCEVITKTCTLDYCQNNGMCENLVNKPVCHCLAGFAGDRCQTTQDICASQPCKNGGTCTAIGGIRFSCLCLSGFTGRTCEENNDDCYERPCRNNGTCRDGYNAFTCDCGTVYTGRNCETRNLLCSSYDCGPGSQCLEDETNNSFICICNEYTELNSRGLSTCKAKDLCARNPCLNNGSCVSTGHSFNCLCPFGYGGSLCQLNNNDCLSIPCENGGKCHDLVGTFYCNCSGTGFQGERCNLPVNDCASQPCNAAGTDGCEDMVNGYHCRCKTGYTGNNCEHEINECDSDPCLHNATCKDMVNGYMCHCPTGWTSKNCETEIKLCTNTTCLNGAMCVDYFNGYFCICKPNTYGENCSARVNICQVTNPCIHGSCQDSNGSFQCTCDDGYEGHQCGIQQNFCNTNKSTCKNDGQCIPHLDSYECKCPQGYTGKDCSVAVDNCLSSRCPFGSTCLNVDGKAYCRCPLDKEGQNCDKEWDQDFDLLFDHEHNIGMAYLPYPIKLNSSAFSISFWLQFGQKDAKGTILSLMTVPEPSSLRGKHLLLWIDEKTIYYNSNGTVVNLTHNIDYRSDGQWHYLVANVNLMAGVLNFYVDTVNSAPVFFPANGMHANSVWLVLGSMYDPVTNMPLRDNGFYGKLSKVTFYSRELQHRDEITILGNTNVSSLFMNSIIRWSSEFKYSNGVIRKAPSEADRSCPFGFTNYSTCDQLLPGKRTVKIVSGQCPNDVLQYSPNRLAQIFWSTPTFSGQDSQSSSFMSGDTFVWGKYSVVIQALNSDGNAAMCLFNIFVQNDNCKTPQTPPEADELRCSAPYEKYKQCALICKNNTAPSIPSPRLYTCGPVGNWDPDNKFVPFRITPCGAISQPVRQIIIALRYSVPTLECTAFKETLEREVLKTQTNLNHEWNYVCTQANCSDTDIKVTCLNTRRRRQAITRRQLDVDVILTLMDIPESVTSRLDGTIKRTEDVYRDLYLALPPANSFNYSNLVSDAVPKLTSLSVLPLCKAPKVFQENQCVDCGRGTFYNETEHECQFCPLNSYQPYQGQNSCVPCPPGTTTATTGSYISSECYDDCPPGQFMNLTYTPPMCTNCSRGLYQPQRGQFSCLFCPTDKTTKYSGTVLDSDCANDCPLGQEISSNNSCTDCRIGFYRSPNDAICQKCPNGTVTQNTSQISMSACNVADNPPGTKRRQDNPRLYDLCPHGTYQSERWQSDCIPCAAHYLTENTGSTDVTNCKFSCPAGLEKKPNEDSCVQCGVGYFRDGVKPFDQCKACPGQFTTLTAGSTSLQNCSLYRCSVGEQPNESSNGCEPCPIGTYQELPDTSRCTPCIAGKSTRSPGATKQDLCESYCSSGAENNGNICQECSIGYFKDNNENVFGNCTRCKDPRYVTSTVGSVSDANCTVLNCIEGYKANLTLQTCDPCPRGTYQNKKYQTDCTPCSQNLYTRYINSTQPQDCETYCESGYEKNGTNCTACQRGYYKDNKVDLFMACTSCGGKYVTPVGPPATIASQCIIRNCQPGSYIDGDNCTLCPKGSFQDQPWQTNCTQCSANRNTETDGATSIAMCLLSCPAGTENNGMSNACDPCMIGYYKDVEAAARCRPCGNFSENDIRITNTNGSTSITNCTKLVCLAGYYPASDKCTPCDFGTYQTTKWTDSCSSCPISYTTYKRGAVTVMDCEYNCSLGEELFNGTCIKCAVGFYNDKSDPSRRQCFQCRGNQITQQEGATSAAQCNIVDCSTRGQYRDVSDNTCKDCPAGTFQDTVRQTSCKVCPTGFNTQSAKSTSAVDCKKDCEAGYSLDSITNTCMACPAGSYRNKTDGNWNCVSCGANLTTVKSASDKLSDCSVPTCSPGYAYNTSQQVCTICPVNSYTDRVGEFLPCTSCPNDKITDREGSSSPEECRDPCSPDYQLHNGQCTYKCDIPNYCGSKGKCIRSPFECRCSEGYSGLLCDIRPDAYAQSDQETETIIIAVVTTVTGLLFIILLIVCICVIIRKRSSVKTSHSFEIDEHTSNTTRSMKGSDDYPAFAVNPAFSSKPPSIFASPNGALASQGIHMYSNPTYNEDEDNDPAVYRA